MGDVATSLAERTRDMRERHAICMPKSDSGNELVPHAELASQPASESATALARRHRDGDDSWDPTLIPDPGPSRRSPEDNDIDVLIEGIGIVEAYNRWCGKMVPNDKGRTESIMISCPVPGHTDSNPSAWMNSDKGTWFCAVCNQGGDKFDLAAEHFGIDYRSTPSLFPELRRKMAEDLGYVVHRTPGGAEYLLGSDVEGRSVPQPLAALPPAPEGDVNEPETTSEGQGLEIDWRKLAPPDTFLRLWMEQCSGDDVPEEFYFWLGLMAIGSAIGRDAVLLGDYPAVLGNLYVCFLGRTGAGKSRGFRNLHDLLSQALPFSPEALKGVRVINSVASAEALVDLLSMPTYDDTDPKKVVSYEPLRGLLYFDELSDLVARGSRQTSTLKPKLIQLFDGYSSLEEHSRTHGSVTASQPFCSVATTTQPASLAELLRRNDVSSGFLNRWVFVQGRAKEPSPFGTPPPHLDQCVSSLQGIRSWASGTAGGIDYDAAGRAAWSKYFNTHLKVLRTNGDEMQKRMDLYLKKLMLLFAANDRARAITADHVEQASTLVDYLSQSWDLVGAAIATDQFDECCKLLLAWIVNFTARDGKPPSAADVNRMFQKKTYSRQMVRRALEHLTTMGELREEVLPTGRGKKVVRYREAAASRAA